ncbi:hypothetical protein LLEC1_03923 [Akanthomyces lecanii]|uniref:Uracil-DNA glycosylase n=1 Tax=Cordyceps confragosa TaxID=2714763 RepID=A0A179I3L3_CORDF|nr:hypothetical protein LLEC1_03923 [Akanthomyces lecanii]
MSSSLKRKATGSGASSPEVKKPKANGNIASFFGAVPKPAQAAAAGSSASAAAAPTTKFDKDKWVSSLTPEQRTLLKLEIDTMHESWLGLLKDDVTTKEFLDLKKFLDRETAAGKKWFPPKEDVYSWSRHTPFNDVKVVIVGQDPYHNVNQAHGMAFSVRPPTPAPPSLRNMYIALAKDYPSFERPAKSAGLLTPWADRGVLMLNTCLTVRAHEANSHSNRGWERLTQRVIDLVAQRRPRGVVFMAWGTPAGKRSVHPSPLSASRGFFDCGHFRKANDWLTARYGAAEGEIDWALVPGNSTLSVPKTEAEAEAESETIKPEKKAATGKENVEVDGEIGSDDEAALEEAIEAAEAEATKP